MNSLRLLSRFDQQRLLAMSPEDRLGMIIRLNGAARYSNRLNVVELMVALAELIEKGAVSGSSPVSPGLSAS
ncbi:MAG: hypothetical protein IPK70_09735 [Flavobacteriales bacterium]|jgi:hypothetical protein|nr:hypothetical protein [Flavobacteriales bacterium]